jgi:hypothetical protein
MLDMRKPNIIPLYWGPPRSIADRQVIPDDDHDDDGECR